MSKSTYDTTLVEDLAKLINEHELAEIEYDTEGLRLRVTRVPAAGFMAAAPVAAAVPAAAPAPAATSAASPQVSSVASDASLVSSSAEGSTSAGDSDSDIAAALAFGFGEGVVFEEVPGSGA